MIIKILKDILRYLPGRLVPALIALISTPVLTNFLTLEQFGHYALVLNTLLLITSLTVSWITSVCLRFNVQHEAKSLHDYLKKPIIVCVIIGCLIWLIAAYLMKFPYYGKIFLFSGLLWIIVQSYYEYYVGWFRAQNLATAYGIALSWRSIVGFSITISILWIENLNVGWIIFSLALSMLIGLPFLIKYSINQFTHKKIIKNNVVNGMEVLKYGIPAALINLVSTSLSFSDRYFIDATHGSEMVAVYSASYDIAEKTVFFVNSILLLSSSAIGFKIFDNEGRQKASEFLTNLMQIYIIFIPLFVIILTVSSSKIFGYIFTREYLAGLKIFPIIAMSGIFVGIMHRYSLLLSFYKRTDLILLCGFGALCVKLFFCLILIREYEMLGAALSTIISYFVWFLLVRIASIQYDAPIFPWKTLLNVITAMIGFYCVYKLINFIFPNDSLSRLLIILILGSICYLLILFFRSEIKFKRFRDV